MPVPAGLSAVIDVSLTTVKFVAAFVPKSTAVAPVKPVPVIVTNVPPPSGPAVGLITETVGAARYVNTSAGDVADVPSGVVTVRSTVPVPAGLSAVIDVSLTTVRFVAAFVPKSTAVAPVKLVPVIVTNVPPPIGPAVGLIAETVGGVGELIGGRGGRRPARRRHGHVHGAVPAGLSAVIDVSLTTVKFVAGVVPKSTAVAPVKPVPVIVTNVPPTPGPPPG